MEQAPKQAPTQEPACETLRCSKHTYNGKADAKRAARQTQASSRGDKVGKLDVYRCDICPGAPWHVGHDRYRRNIRDRAS